MKIYRPKKFGLKPLLVILKEKKNKFVLPNGLMGKYEKYLLKLNKMNIALFLVAVPDLKGGGGAERQFCNFYEYFNSPENHSKNKLYLITDKDSLKNLKNADIL